MNKIHYVYKLIEPETNRYYIGSRTFDGNPEDDFYMGSMQVRNPDKSKLKKIILRDDFKTREDAIEYEANLIERNIDDELNENYHIPTKGFHVLGLSGYFKGKKFTEEHKNKLRKFREGKSWEYVYGIDQAKNMKKTLSEKYSNEGNPMYGIIPNE